MFICGHKGSSPSPLPGSPPFIFFIAHWFRHSLPQLADFSTDFAKILTLSLALAAAGVQRKQKMSEWTKGAGRRQQQRRQGSKTKSNIGLDSINHIQKPSQDNLSVRLASYFRLPRQSWEGGRRLGLCAAGRVGPSTPDDRFVDSPRPGYISRGGAA